MSARVDGRARDSQMSEQDRRQGGGDHERCQPQQSADRGVGDADRLTVGERLGSGHRKAPRTERDCGEHDRHGADPPAGRLGAGRRAGTPAPRGCQPERKRPRDRHVQPEDRLPACDGEDQPAVERPEHAPQLLNAADHPEGEAATVGGPEVGHQGEGHRHQAAATEPLEGAAGHHRAEVVRGCGHERPGREGAETEQEQRPATVDVGEPPQQRHDDDIAEQEAAHDRGRGLELVDTDADVGHDRGQREHDHVRVDRGDEHGGRRDAEGPAPPGVHPVGGGVTDTFSP